MLPTKDNPICVEYGCRIYAGSLLTTALGTAHRHLLSDGPVTKPSVSLGCTGAFGSVGNKCRHFVGADATERESRALQSARAGVPIDRHLARKTALSARLSSLPQSQQRPLAALASFRRCCIVRDLLEVLGFRQLYNHQLLPTLGRPKYRLAGVREGEQLVHVQCDIDTVSRPRTGAILRRRQQPERSGWTSRQIMGLHRPFDHCSGV